MINPEAILESKKTTLLVEKRAKTRIVIGSPHHAPVGVEHLPCKEHPDSDENAGIIARRIAENIRASSIIACNYHIDANKSLGTDYSLQIINWNPKYLIEIHGHSGRKTKAKNEIEISSGSIEQNDLSVKFASKLQEKLSMAPGLNQIPVNGNFKELYFRASNTATITSGRWKALHIELPPILRKEGTNLPGIANDFINLLSETILEICI